MKQVTAISCIFLLTGCGLSERVTGGDGLFARRTAERDATQPLVTLEVRPLAELSCSELAELEAERRTLLTSLTEEDDQRVEVTRAQLQRIDIMQDVRACT